MDFMDAVRLLWRRRLVVVAGILLTGLGCAAVILQVQTVYQATGQYLLLLPADAGGKKNPVNPLINQPQGLIVAAGLVASEVNTPEVQREMDDEGFDADSSLALAPDNGALLTIQVSDTDPEATIAKRDEIIRRLDQELERIQTQEIPGVPANQVIRSVVFADGQEAEAVPGAKIRALLVVVAVGAVLTLVAAFSLDRPLTRRRERRRTSGAAGADDTEAPSAAAAPESGAGRDAERPRHERPRHATDPGTSEDAREPVPVTQRESRRR